MKRRQFIKSLGAIAVAPLVIKMADAEPKYIVMKSRSIGASTSFPQQSGLSVPEVWSPKLAANFYAATIV